MIPPMTLCPLPWKWSLASSKMSNYVMLAIFYKKMNIFLPNILKCIIVGGLKQPPDIKIIGLGFDIFAGRQLVWKWRKGFLFCCWPRRCCCFFQERLSWESFIYCCSVSVFSAGNEGRDICSSKVKARNILTYFCGLPIGNLSWLWMIIKECFRK